jgi:hypothetical protein
MQRALWQTIFIFAGAFCYAYLFWWGSMGINTLLFAAFAITGLFQFRPELRKSRNVILLATGTVLTALLVIWHHSALARISHILSFTLLIGAVQIREVRFIGFALLLGLSGLFEAPLQLLRQIERDIIKNPQLKQAIYWLRMVLLPLGLGLLFLMLYLGASHQFATLIENSWGRFLGNFLKLLDFERIFYWVWGLLIMGGLMYSSYFLDLLSPTTADYSFTLSRKRQPKSKSKRTFKLLALKHEYRLGLLTFALLNGIVLLFNITDLRYVWIEYEDTSAAELSQYVHEGTWLLLFTIGLAVAVVLFFFRKNLNFFPDNDLLKTLSGIWIFQNLILALSVGMRNWHYVAHYGLAYKRIGVFFFLLLVCFGLWAIQQKVFARRTRFFLLQTNTWAIYALLLLASTINWDTLITRYNIQANTPNPIDVRFLVQDISDKNLTILQKNKTVLAQRSTFTDEEIERMIAQKEARFIKDNLRQNWRGWNRADYLTLLKLRKPIANQ